MQQYENLSLVTTAVLHVRSWELAHLPTEQSALAFDLLTLAVHRTALNEGLQLKHLFLLLQHYSEAGVRKQLRRCLREGWLRLVVSSTDKRVRHIVAEPKLMQLYERYAEVLEHVYAQLPPD